MKLIKLERLIDNIIMREDWIKCKFDDLVEIVSGKNQKDVESNDGEYPIYGSGGIIGRANNYLSRENSTIIGRKGNINSPIYVKEKFWNIDTAFGLESKTILDSKLLYYFCTGYNFKQLDKSTAVPSLAKRDILNIEFPLSPLPEQRAIVAKIEQLFNELDNGIANLMTAQEQLKIYRQAVLKKAFEGEWKKAFVGDLFDFMGGGTPSKQEPLYWNGDIPWASVKDIKGDYLKKTQDYITETGVNNSSTNIAKKDEVILITRISPGKTVITLFDVSVNQDLKIIKPKFKTYNVFIHYLFKSIEWDIVKLSSGTTVLGINLTNLKSIEIPKIELEEQHQIVQQIESRLSVCDKVEETITVNLQKAEALRQSILKKAFAGELLTEAEIAACKKEPDWEPAGELLKRIKKEKTKS